MLTGPVMVRPAAVVCPLVYVCWHSRTIPEWWRWYSNDAGDGQASITPICDILLYVLCIVFVVIYFEIFKFVRQQPRQLPQYGTNGHYYMTCGGCLKPWTRFGLWINTITFCCIYILAFGMQSCYWVSPWVVPKPFGNGNWSERVWSVKHTWAAYW